ncbi:MAG: UDP-N-acetylenolpyruvoylglucosamine reductase, partial [Deltaproteobacteria bacterium]
AGKLIEEAGLKGVRVRGAKVSELHANFIVNTGEARAKDIIILMDLIKDKVAQKTGIKLVPEIKVIGED